MKKFVCLFVCLFAGSANATIINFESDSAGSVANGFTSVDASGVHFSDTLGSGLSILTSSPETDGQSLVVFSDDASRLGIDFDSTYDFLSFDFGNDNPGFGDPDGQMHLDLSYRLICFNSQLG